MLVVTEGALQGTTLSLTDAPVTMGRGHDCTLVLDDDYASTHHARLSRTAEGWVLEDLGSTNGTYLGRSKVTRPTAVPEPLRVWTWRILPSLPRTRASMRRAWKSPHTETEEISR